MRRRLLIPALLTAAAAACAAAAWAQAENLARLNVEETQLSADQARNMNQLARLLSVIAQFERDPPPALLVSPEDAKDAVRAAILVKAMTPDLQAKAQVYARQAHEMMRQRRLAAVQSEALFTTESELADAAPEPGDGAPVLGRSIPEGPVTPPARLAQPAAGSLLRRFGEPLPGGGRSNGLTWTTAQKAPVASPSAGLVQYVGPVKGWGVILILRLPGGYHLVLAGLERASVAVGQSVAPGQPVGWMPDGRHSAPELYLEVREQGVPADPGRWLAN
jgi:septal ring factor EnvC (AmiA/AmiB activator)